MKKALFVLSIVSIIFAACKKEDEVVAPTLVNGCTDSIANNYNELATVDDGSCIYGIVGLWTPTSVDVDSSMTTTIAGEVVQELDGELMTYSGSQTMTAEEAGFEGSIEFTAYGEAITLEDTSSYTYLNNVLTIIDEDEDMTFTCSVTSTSLSLTFEASMDTAFNEPSLIMLGYANGDITISSYFGQTINCSRNSVVNTNVSQRIRENNHSCFVKPKLDNSRIINKLKK